MTMPAPVRVIIAEDERAVRESLSRALTLEGYSVTAVSDGAQALEAMRAESADVLVLDVMMPVVDGLTACRVLRSEKNRVPILLLTARTETSDRVAGLDAGADDYLPKPFAMEELVARLQALFRRPGQLLGRKLTFGNVALDTEGRQVFVAGASRTFPARETAVLEILMRRGGNVAPKRLFEDHLFGLSGDVGSNAVEVYVHRLRKMLAESGATVKIHTVRGVGYLMAEDKKA